MTAEQLIDLVIRFGLPTAMLIAFVFALHRRIFVTGAHASTLEKEGAYKDERRLEEREARIAAEKVAATSVNVLNEFTRLTHGLILRAAVDEKEPPHVA